jgi:GT2 family glycosyltransferase
LTDLKSNSDEETIDVSIVIVSFNTKEVTRQCLEHVQKHAAVVPHEVLVVDNASEDGSADMVAAEFPRVHLIRQNENRGFAGGNNPAMEIARGRYILLLNSDAFTFFCSIPMPFWLKAFWKRPFITWMIIRTSVCWAAS